MIPELMVVFLRNVQKKPKAHLSSKDVRGVHEVIIRWGGTSKFLISEDDIISGGACAQWRKGVRDIIV